MSDAALVRDPRLDVLTHYLAPTWQSADGPHPVAERLLAEIDTAAGLQREYRIERRRRDYQPDGEWTLWSENRDRLRTTDPEQAREWFAVEAAYDATLPIERESRITSRLVSAWEPVSDGTEAETS